MSTYWVVGRDIEQHGAIQQFCGCFDGTEPVPSLAVFADCVIARAFIVTKGDQQLGCQIWFPKEIQVWDLNAFVR
jgi:hypothetical protein